MRGFPQQEPHQRLSWVYHCMDNARVSFRGWFNFCFAKLFSICFYIDVIQSTLMGVRKHQAYLVHRLRTLKKCKPAWPTHLVGCLVLVLFHGIGMKHEAKPWVTLQSPRKFQATWLACAVGRFFLSFLPPLACYIQLRAENRSKLVRLPPVHAPLPQ